MASVGEEIVQRICDALNNGAAPPCTFERTRVDPLDASELPAGTVFCLSDKAERFGEGEIAPLRRRSSQLPDVATHERAVRIELQVAGLPPVDANVDPIYLYIVQTLMADAELADLIRGLYEAELQFETEASFEDRTLAILDFRVVFATKATDPAVQVEPI